MRKIISATWAIKKRWAHSFYRQRKEYVGGVELRFLGAFREAINVILAEQGAFPIWGHFFQNKY